MFHELKPDLSMEVAVPISRRSVTIYLLSMLQKSSESGGNALVAFVNTSTRFSNNKLSNTRVDCFNMTVIPRA